MRLLLIVLCTALAGSAAAQPTAPPLPLGFRLAEPATPEQVEAARREADALVAQAGAADVFENVTDGASPEIRHRASGLVCNFRSGSDVNRVLIFPSPFPRGDDVGCNTEGEGHTTTYYATRFGAGRTTVDEQLQGALQSIRVRYPNARPSEEPLAQASRPGLPEHRSARLVIQGPDGRNMVARVSVALVGDWLIKQRVSATADNLVQTDLMSELMFMAVLDGVQQRTSGASRVAEPSTPR